MLRRPCGRAMRSKGRVDVDAVASKPGVAKEVLPLTRRILRYVCSRGGSWVNTTLCRTHGLKSGACRRPDTERQGLPMRPSHDSVWRSESSLHTVGPPVLLNSIIGTPGGRYMRLVTPLRAPFAAPIAPSHRGGLVQHFPPRQQYTASRLGTWRGPAGSRATVANAKGNLAPLLSRVGPSSMPVVVGRHGYVIKIRCPMSPISYGCAWP